jgi:hypothetical protein
MEQVFGFKGLEMQSAPLFAHGIEKTFGFKGVEMRTAESFAKPLEKVFGFKGVELIMDYRGSASIVRKRYKIASPLSKGGS